MTLTFQQAKLTLNPDPEWMPEKDSPEFAEILRIMVISGYKPENIVPKKYTVADLFATKALVNPMNRPPPRDAPVKKMSKREFLSIESNRKYVEEHMKRNNK
jgi:hypothetical protein